MMERERESFMDIIRREIESDKKKEIFMDIQFTNKKFKNHKRDLSC